ncbi:MAG: M23 family metallopeptidase [Epsilonproteobacteria bacterium]|nr:M23 family metallopeptidase [Campylobacterota bacterium]
MIKYVKYVCAVLVASFCLWWCGDGMYRYATHNKLPEVALSGLCEGGTYCKQVACALCADNSYKISTVSVFLDGVELDGGSVHHVRTARFTTPFVLDCSKLTDGKHTLEVEAVDASYKQNKIRHSYNFYVDNVPLRAQFVQQEYVTDQGKTVHMKIHANKKLESLTVTALSKTYEFLPESFDSTVYECFVPIDCEELANEHVVTAQVVDPAQNKTKLTAKLKINAFEFKKQRGFRVSDQKLEDERELSVKNDDLENRLEACLKDSPKQKLWTGPFEYPIEVQRTSTPFGEVRMTPQRGKYMHKGLDLINTPRSVVWASQHGRVIIKDRFLMTGNTVAIDHGRGVCTVYAHLDDFADINVGDMVRKGNPIGKIGMTGYANGYHLHWEVRVHNTPVEPSEWTSKIY